MGSPSFNVTKYIIYLAECVCQTKLLIFPIKLCSQRWIGLESTVLETLEIKPVRPHINLI